MSESEAKKSRYLSLRAHLEEFLGEMSDEERHVQLGIAFSHYTLGYLTLEEFDRLQELLGFSDYDVDTLLF